MAPPPPHPLGGYRRGVPRPRGADRVRGVRGGGLEGVVTLLELAALALWAWLFLGALAVVLLVCGLVGEWRRGVGG